MLQNRRGLYSKLSSRKAIQKQNMSLHQKKPTESYFNWKFNSWIIQFWTKVPLKLKNQEKVWHCVLATVHALPAEAKVEGGWNQRVRHFSHHIVVRSVQLPVLLLRGFPHSEVLRFWNFKFLKSGLFSAFFSKKMFMEP